MKALQSSTTAASLLSAFSAQGCDARSLQAFASLHCEVQLRYVRVLLSEPCERNESMARDLCIAITETAATQAPCRAWAHYYIGLLFVKASRQTGALYQLWIDHSAGVNEDKSRTNGNQDGQHAIVMARYHFREALALIGPASDVLSRDAMRSLALLAGPSKREEVVGTSAAALVHSSIGATSRQVVSSVVASDEKQDDVFDSILIDNRPDGCSDEALYHLFDALDTGLSELSERNKRINFLYAQAGKSLPSNWRVVAIALCPTGEILISSLAASTDQSKSSMPDIDTVCIFPNIDNDSILDSTAYNDLMKPLDALIRLNEDQISGLDVTTVADNFKEESAKRDWWNERQCVDDELQSLVENTESKYFSSDCVRRIFLGSHYEGEDDVSALCGNLASRFEMACTIADTTTDNNVDDCSDEASHLNENCMLLILDENLHRFPFEGMEVCSKWAVSRIPSLPFAIAPLLESRSGDDERSDLGPFIDPIDASYIVDPEGNLSQTKKRLVPAIDDICDRHGWNWGAVIGTLPSEDFVQNALTQRKGLILYCGHGGATACFSRSQVEGLMKGTTGKSATRRCRSTIILMGCSSGKLVSVNRKDSKTTDKVTMFYEPEGIALSYLCAGAPCVVGNLWDVTDRDIDRYVSFLSFNFGPICRIDLTHEFLLHSDIVSRSLTSFSETMKGIRWQSAWQKPARPVK
jgi:separase